MESEKSKVVAARDGKKNPNVIESLDIYAMWQIKFVALSEFINIFPFDNHSTAISIDVIREAFRLRFHVSKKLTHSKHSKANETKTNQETTDKSCDLAMQTMDGMKRKARKKQATEQRT